MFPLDAQKVLRLRFFQTVDEVMVFGDGLAGLALDAAMVLLQGAGVLSFGFELSCVCVLEFAVQMPGDTVSLT